MGAADHFVEGGSGGDHGVDAVFFFYLEVDEEGFAGGAGFCDGGGYVLAFGDVGAFDAVGGGEEDEVGGEDGGGGVVFVVEGLLPLADHAEKAIVDHRNVYRQALLSDGGEFGGSHLEAAVTGDDPDVFFGAGHFCSDRSW